MSDIICESFPKESVISREEKGKKVHKEISYIRDRGAKGTVKSETCRKSQRCLSKIR